MTVKACKIIAVVNGKGGVGKSTSSINIALDLKKKGYNVALFDGEKNGTTISLRERGDIDVYPAYDRLISQTLQAHKNSYDFLVVDTAGVNASTSSNGENLQEIINSKIIATADLVIVPLVPSPVDIRKTITFLDGLEPFIDASRGHLKTLIVLNRFRSNEKLSAEVKAYLEENYTNHPYHRFDNTLIRQSTTVEQADGLYQSVNEYAPGSLVASDFKRLTNTIISLLEA
uniref:Chromosome (Plasmid) partitioning protein ParA n=1 Tax=Vibrio sp. FF_291 TaxID=1652832 RepID=A0A0H3ZT18_9VIBR|nr:Chromosome (plasmid) partitioning protein ParA [Vibrio sp. FF_291]